MLQGATWPLRSLKEGFLLSYRLGGSSEAGILREPHTSGLVYGSDEQRHSSGDERAANTENE